MTHTLRCHMSPLSFSSLDMRLTRAATGRRESVWLIVVTATLQMHSVARLVRASAMTPGCRTVAEALRMQGRSGAYIHLRHLTRKLAGPLVTDAGARFSGVLHLLASAKLPRLGAAFVLTGQVGAHRVEH